jgi:hypothetical protein
VHACQSQTQEAASDCAPVAAARVVCEVRWGVQT